MVALGIDLLAIAEKRLVWAGERQAILARNIANVSTPGFTASDIVDFQQALASRIGGQPARTVWDHLPGTVNPGRTARTVQATATRTTGQNAVRLEDQLMKVADTETTHATVTAIYKKYMAMFATALGRPV